MSHTREALLLLTRGPGRAVRAREQRTGVPFGDRSTISPREIDPSTDGAEHIRAGGRNVPRDAITCRDQPTTSEREQRWRKRRGEKGNECSREATGRARKRVRR